VVRFMPDGVILDLNAPKVEGIEVLRRIRNSPELRHLPVAIVTSSEFPKDKSDAAALGATCYILKSARLSEFLSGVGSSIKKMLER
ncbi:MAG: response regulator, partial [Bryobacteraceae bacterium]